MTDTSGTAPPFPPAASSRYAVLAPRPAGELASDILRGADEIAQFLFGQKRFRRRVYALIERKSFPYPASARSSAPAAACSCNGSRRRNASPARNVHLWTKC